MTQEDPITNALGQAVNGGDLAGAVTLIWRGGTVVHTAAVGSRDIETRLPIERDTIFRIASMSKPITSLAAMMLFEEGRFQLEDPITRLAPEFATMRVLTSPDGSIDDTVPAERQITFEDLLTQRSGLTYGPLHRGPIAKAYDDALGGDIDSWVAPDDWIRGLASLPLIDQPGAGFHYSHSTDLMGLLIARMEGASLGEVLQRRIFGPLEMKDTGFIVPRENRARRSALHGFDDDGRLVKRLTGPDESTLPERPDDMPYESGGQGLWSTLDDYLAFARIFVGRGSVDGFRLLKPETVNLMTTNRLTETQIAGAKLMGMPMLGAGHGFGLGVALVIDPEKASASRPCGGGLGSVGWPGGFGGWWRADPSNDSVLIFLSHSIVELDQLERGYGLGVFIAINEFQALASAVGR